MKCENFNSKFGSSGDFGDFLFQRGSFVKETGSTSNDSMESLIGVSTVKELGLFFPPIVFKMSRVSDGIDIDVPRGLGGGLLVEGVVTGEVSSVREVKVL